jgi:hypothetical protein
MAEALTMILAGASIGHGVPEVFQRELFTFAENPALFDFPFLRGHPGHSLVTLWKRPRPSSPTMGFE